jgi:pyruvate/2-oxoglutarate dehydrogenase complex dihydrolipoamide acyltransferase (E2) component
MRAMSGRGLTPERILALSGTAGLLVVALVILIMLMGGGGDDEQAAGPAAQATAEPEATKTATPEPTVAPLTAEQRAERDAAAAMVEERGYDPQDLHTWQPDHTLRVLFGEPLDGPEGTLRAFFFVAGEAVGSDAPDASGDVKISVATRNQVRLRYRLYRPGDDPEDPTGDVRRVRFRWDGGALQTLDTVPTAPERRPPGS